ncbi:MAG: hypothetical protein NWF06_06165 [Candidatus Bathyarchaeota archaeon]|nr:hypothetical protein [Candidatus Bathyarchaeum sp.]
MNKIILYVGLAILLGTVTMIAPLAVLKPEDTVMDIDNTLLDPEYTLSVPNAEEQNSQNETYEAEKGMLESGDFSTDTWTEGNVTISPSEPSEPVAAPEDATRKPLTVNTADSSSDLSSVALMAVPSFLVALGFFVVLRKRIS